MDWADEIAARCISDGMGDGDTARLIANALRAEREACAKIAEGRAKEGEHGTWQGQEGLIIAADIRARSNEQQ